MKLSSDGTENVAHPRPKKSPGGASSDSAELVPAAPAPERKKGGAPRGNVNAARDKRFTRAMKAAQEAARRGRRRRRELHQVEAHEVIREAGLVDSPLGKRLAHRLGAIDHEIDELTRIVERVGRTRRDGTIGPVYEKLLQLTQQDRQELRQLIDRLAALGRPGDEAEVVYVATMPDITAAKLDSHGRCSNCGVQIAPMIQPMQGAASTASPAAAAGRDDALAVEVEGSAVPAAEAAPEPVEPAMVPEETTPPTPGNIVRFGPRPRWDWQQFES